MIKRSLGDVHFTVYFTSLKNILRGGCKKTLTKTHNPGAVQNNRAERTKISLRPKRKPSRRRTGVRRVQAEKPRTTYAVSGLFFAMLCQRTTRNTAVFRGTFFASCKKSSRSRFIEVLKERIFHQTRQKAQEGLTPAEHF